MGELYKYEHINPFSDGALILRDHCAHMLTSKEEELYICNMAWIAADVWQVSRSRLFEGENALKEVWRN